MPESIFDIPQTTLNKKTNRLIVLLIIVIIIVVIVPARIRRLLRSRRRRRRHTSDLARLTLALSLATLTSRQRNICSLHALRDL